MIRSIVIVIIFALAVGYITVLNPIRVPFYWTPDSHMEIPLMLLLYLSFAFGVMVSLLALLARDTVRAYRNYNKKKIEERKRQSEELYNQAVEEILKGDSRTAEKKLEAALERNPDNLKAYVRLAEIREAQNRLRDAIDILTRAKSLWRDDIDLSFRLAKYYEKLNDTNNAIDILKKMLFADEENLEALRMLRDIYSKNGRLEEAYRIQKEIVKINRKGPNYFRERKLMGQFKYGYVTEIIQQGDIDKAIKKLGDVMKQSPDFVPAYVLLGELYIKNKSNYEKASETWEKAYLSLKHPVFLIKLEEMCLELERPSEILEVYRRLLAQQPDDAILRFFYARLCLRLEMLDAAREQLNAIEGRGINSSYFHLLMAEVQARSGDYASSVKEFRKASDIVNRIIIPFVCSNCGYEAKEWTVSCRNCNSVNTLNIEIGMEYKQREADLKVS